MRGRWWEQHDMILSHLPCTAMPHSSFPWPFWETPPCMQRLMAKASELRLRESQVQRTRPCLQIFDPLWGFLFRPVVPTLNHENLVSQLFCSSHPEEGKMYMKHSVSCCLELKAACSNALCKTVSQTRYLNEGTYLFPFSQYKVGTPYHLHLR